MRFAPNHPLMERLHALLTEYHDIDQIIERIGADPTVDQLLLRRLKKRRLYLKDQIKRLESELIPDLDA